MTPISNLPLGLILTILEAVGTLVVAYTLLRALRLAQRWSVEYKRGRTFDIITSISATRNPLFRGLPIVEAEERLNATENIGSDPVLEEIFMYLNRLESLSIGIRNGFYDEDVLFEFMGNSFVAGYRKCQRFIEKARSKTKNDSVYINVEAIARRWEGRIP